MAQSCEDTIAIPFLSPLHADAGLDFVPAGIDGPFLRGFLVSQHGDFLAPRPTSPTTSQVCFSVVFAELRTVDWCSLLRVGVLGL